MDFISILIGIAIGAFSVFLGFGLKIFLPILKMYMGFIKFARDGLKEPKEGFLDGFIIENEDKDKKTDV